MKKLITLTALVVSTVVLAQTPTAPVIKAKYYTMKNTAMNQVWDNTKNMKVPATRTNITSKKTFAKGKYTNIFTSFSFKFIFISSSSVVILFTSL